MDVDENRSPVLPSRSKRLTKGSVRSAEMARGTGRLVQVLAWLSLFGGVIAGISLMTQTEDVDCGSYCEDATSHPYSAAGLALICSSLIFSALLLMMSSYVRMRAFQVLEDNGVA